MAEKTFTAPSGMQFTYQVDADGQLSRHDLITWADDCGLMQYLRGTDLVALAIAWVEREILELEAVGATDIVCAAVGCAKVLTLDTANIILTDDVTDTVCTVCLPGALESGGNTNIDSYYDGAGLVTLADATTLDVYAFGYDSDRGVGSYKLDDLTITAIQVQPSS